MVDSKVALALFIFAASGTQLTLSIVPPPDCLQVACKCPQGTIWTTDSNGCKKCTCRECPPVPLYCPRYCRFELDARGCRTCNCDIPDPIECLPLRCKYPPLDCPNGYLIRNGCPTCECKPGPVCPVLRCLGTIDCKYGFKKDANGCDICECEPGPICPPLPCLAFTSCLGGFQKDANDCDTCQCKPSPICPPVQCPDESVCQWGTISLKGPNGCVTSCRCRPPLVPVDPPSCPRGACSFYCKNPDIYRARISSCSCVCSATNQY